MSPKTDTEPLERLLDRLAANRQPVERLPWIRHEHPRGWNDALDFVERCIKEIAGEKADHINGPVA